MKIVVLGSGVIGVTNAYFLAKAGHEVTVVDRQPAAALETSYANAGQISPGYSSPWSAPGVPLKAVKWMMQDLAPLRIQPALDPVLFKWMTKMLSNCTESAYRVNKSRMLRIAEYSRDSMNELNDEVSIDYDQRFGGTLQVFRTEKQVISSKADVAILKECGVRHEVLDRQGCIDAEPALAHVKEKIIGGLRLPGDGTGDCFKFTQGLVAECEKLGVTFMYNTDIKGLILEAGKIQGVQLASEVLKADSYVMALGSYSPIMLGKVGIKLPVYPVKGYSLTLPIIDETRAPVSTVMDETYKIAVTRFNDRIRVGGTAELTGYDMSLKAKRRNNVDFVVGDLFAGGGDLEKAEFWTGLRPMTPDGTPVLGATKYPNLFLNTGHGTLGWTMAVGSARYVSDIISGRKPDIDPSGLGMERYV
ncbi:D-amino acid dehydrogenase [Neptunomonas qingdaonensis]|uniref:D-amino acid dehydrogenase n=1 Tax=Neptunomonas qingdaonensis TaxID=1045558 RepID=A0A1I2QAF1_9GAMM|nr:D-amino acid dehydrogenase [Neptunomonas qingdaonensis]SFG23247.1 D-amino-acid dehydrogenase [Neptunomonas qingdaonensis]